MAGRRYVTQRGAWDSPAPSLILKSSAARTRSLPPRSESPERPADVPLVPTGWLIAGNGLKFSAGIKSKNKIMT